jgi:hypothetical protein
MKRETSMDMGGLINMKQERISHAYLVDRNMWPIKPEQQPDEKTLQKR